jgi:hypothetical protein
LPREAGYTNNDCEEPSMYRKALIGGAAAAAVVCAGGTALALSGSGTTSGSPATTSAAAALHAGFGRAHILRRLAHGQFVLRGKDGFVTHDVIVGTVTAVTSTSITVRAADNTSETFAVTQDTKVRLRSDGTGSPATIGQVADGDHVLVAGIGTSALTAKHVLDLK